MARTKRGIYHNLKESTYTVSNSEIVFFFSSQYHLNKFMKEYHTHRQKFNGRFEKLSSQTPLNMDMLADISLYKTVETRGFRAWLKGVDIDWQEIHRYALRRMTEENSLNWHVMQKPKLAERRRIMA